MGSRGKYKRALTLITIPSDAYSIVLMVLVATWCDMVERRVAYVQGKYTMDFIVDTIASFNKGTVR